MRARPTSSGRYQGNEMNIPSNDGAASDSLSSTSEEVGAATTSVTSATATMNTGEIGDNGKPLSFARIASLNLEKQAIHRPPKTASGQSTGSSDSMNPNMMMNAQQNNLAAAAAAAASMASMSMAEAAQAVVVAAQQSMNHHHAHHPMSGKNEIRGLQSQLLIEPIWCHVTCRTGESENSAFVALPSSPKKY